MAELMANDRPDMTTTTSGAASSGLPIVPWASVDSALDHFHEAGGAPSEMHASVFPRDKFSGTTIALLVKTFKQLGMADESGKTNHQRLDPFINPETRKAAFQKLLSEVYGSLITGLPLATGSPNQFNKWFDDYHMNPEDTRKAKTFFLHAAKANEIPVSPFIANKYKTRTRAPGKQKQRKERSPKPPATPRRNVEDNGNGGGGDPGDSALDRLLEKFPSFDPAWSPEVQAKWFEAFGKLQDQLKK